MASRTFLAHICVLLIFQVYGHPTKTEDNSASNVDSKDKLVYINVTVYHQEPKGNFTLTYNILPVAESVEFAQLQNEVDEEQIFQDSEVPSFRDTGREDAVLDALISEALGSYTTTKAPSTSRLPPAVQTFLQRLQTIPSAAVTTIGNLAEEVRELLGVNVTQVRTKPIGTAVQTINNIAFCNPIFAGFNPGRCNGFLSATP